MASELRIRSSESAALLRGEDLRGRVGARRLGEANLPGAQRQMVGRPRQHMMKNGGFMVDLWWLKWLNHQELWEIIGLPSTILVIQSGFTMQTIMNHGGICAI